MLNTFQIHKITALVIIIYKNLYAAHLHSEVTSNWPVIIKSQKHYLQSMHNILLAVVVLYLIHYNKMYNRIPELNPKYHIEIK